MRLELLSRLIRQDGTNPKTLYDLGSKTGLATLAAQIRENQTQQYLIEQLLVFLEKNPSLSTLSIDDMFSSKEKLNIPGQYRDIVKRILEKFAYDINSFTCYKKDYEDYPLLLPPVLRGNLSGQVMIEEGLSFFLAHLGTVSLPEEEQEDYQKRINEARKFGNKYFLNALCIEYPLLGRYRGTSQLLPIRPTLVEIESANRWLLSFPPVAIAQEVYDRASSVFAAFSLPVPRLTAPKWDVSMLAMPEKETAGKSSQELLEKYRENSEKLADFYTYVMPYLFFRYAISAQSDISGVLGSSFVRWFREEAPTALHFLQNPQHHYRRESRWHRFPDLDVPYSDHIYRLKDVISHLKDSDKLLVDETYGLGFGLILSGLRTNLIYELTKIVNPKFSEKTLGKYPTVAETFLENLVKIGILERDKKDKAILYYRKDAPEFISLQTIAQLAGANDQETIGKFMRNFIMHRGIYLEKETMTELVKQNLRDRKITPEEAAYFCVFNILRREKQLLSFDEKEFPNMFGLDLNLDLEVSQPVLIDSNGEIQHIPLSSVGAFENAIRKKDLQHHLETGYNKIRSIAGKRLEDLEEFDKQQSSKQSERQKLEESIVHLKAEVQKLQKDLDYYKQKVISFQGEKSDREMFKSHEQTMQGRLKKDTDRIEKWHFWRIGHFRLEQIELDARERLELARGRLDLIAEEEKMLHSRLTLTDPEEVQQWIRPFLSSMSMLLLSDKKDVIIARDPNSEEVKLFGIGRDNEGRFVATAKSRALLKLYSIIQELDYAQDPEKAFAQELLEKTEMIFKEFEDALANYPDESSSAEEAKESEASSFVPAMLATTAEPVDKGAQAENIAKNPKMFFAQYSLEELEAAREALVKPGSGQKGFFGKVAAFLTGKPGEYDFRKLIKLLDEVIEEKSAGDRD